MPNELEQTEEVFEVEYTTREEYIGCAYQCLIAIESYNAMTQAELKLVKNIQYKSLEILNTLVNEMYDELFDNNEQ